MCVRHRGFPTFRDHIKIGLQADRSQESLNFSQRKVGEIISGDTLNRASGISKKHPKRSPSSEEGSWTREEYLKGIASQPRQMNRIKAEYVGLCPDNRQTRK
ncbi:unnamed protein product [Caretta caretta]